MHRNVVKRSMIVVRVPVEMKKELERHADNDRRSISDYVRMALEDHLERLARKSTKRVR